jgi:hypothetical protein
MGLEDYLDFQRKSPVAPHGLVATTRGHVFATAEDLLCIVTWDGCRDPVDMPLCIQIR